MALREYRRKRNFERTPEPPGPAPEQRLYVIQKHQARRLHYDLRLELDGVLLSWAVPKGPSLDPAEKRLAVRTEDHPIEYGSFEGVIPRGEYGAGTVMLWDRGSWEPLVDPRAGLEEGQLKIRLAGEKLRGAWALVRMTGPRSDGGKNWLLIKERDGEVRREQDFSVTGEMPYSVASRRTMAEIAAARDRSWSSSAASPQLAEPGRRPPATAHADEQLGLDALTGTRRAALPPPGPRRGALRPPSATPAAEAPDGDAWLHELAVGGARLLAFIQADRVRLLDADGRDLTARLPDLAHAVAALPVSSAVLDGEAAVLDARGHANDAALAAVLDGTQRAAAVIFHAYDLPFCAGYDLRRAPLAARKAVLQRLLQGAAGAVRYWDHVAGNGPAVLEQARRLGARGLVSRRAESRYPTGAARDWRCVLFDATGDPPAPQRAAQPVAMEPGLTLRGVRITNPHRVLWPEERVTKRDLAHYYDGVADWMLPHVVHRPLSLYRCPEGHEGDCWYQKHLGGISTPHLRDAPVREHEGKEPYIALDGAAGLITLAQLAVLEVHPWGSREDSVDRPDRLVFDLDPGPGVGWRQLVTAARDLRALLTDLGLEGFLKTSGGKGLHVVVPIARRGDWSDAKRFTAGVAKRMAERDPKLYTATIAAWAREGRVFIDYLRNVRGATCVAPFSPRARPGAAVSAPLHWDELDATPIVYTLRTMPRRLAMLRADPWSGFAACRQSVTKAMQRAVGVAAR